MKIFAFLLTRRLRNFKENLKKFSLKVDVVIKVGYPVLKNDRELTLSSIKLAKEFLGEKNVVDLSYRMTAEDFTF